MGACVRVRKPSRKKNTHTQLLNPYFSHIHFTSMQKEKKNNENINNKTECWAAVCVFFFHTPNLAFFAAHLFATLHKGKMI